MLLLLCICNAAVAFKYAMLPLLCQSCSAQNDKHTYIMPYTLLLLQAAEDTRLLHSTVSLSFVTFSLSTTLSLISNPRQQLHLKRKPMIVTQSHIN
jgi:hypothetical protein